MERKVKIVNGSIVVKNFSAYHLPNLGITRKIGNTEYTIRGSYDGKECLAIKVQRRIFDDKDR